jgi:hypothetical protein
MSDESPVAAPGNRSAMIQRTRVWSSLDEVAEAVAVASESESMIYVERLADLYRWSLATKGGGYPLLRITARFLGVDFREIYVGFRTLPDGVAVLCEDPSNFDVPVSWAVLKLSGEIPPATASQRIRNAVGHVSGRN